MKKVLHISFFLLILWGTQNALAQTPQPSGPTDDHVNTIAKQLYCPVCENIPLDVCGTQACAQWRDLIRQKLTEGWTDTQIKEYFVIQYGDRVLATPPAKGINWLVYLVPPLALLFGVYILYRSFQSWKKPLPKADNSESHTSKQDKYIKRIEQELSKR